MNYKNKFVFTAVLTFVLLLIVPLCSSFALADLSLSPTSLTFELEAGDKAYKTFTLTYTNSLPIQFNGNFTYKDPDPDVDMSLNVSTFSLAPGDSIKVKVTIDVDEDADSGTYSEKIKIYNTDSNTKEKELPVTVEVGGVGDYCKYGEQGDYLTLTIEEPDSGDDFYVGENITIKVKVENSHTDDLDVVVEAELYDLTDDDSIADTDKETTIDADDTKTITLYLKVPSTVDTRDDFVLRVKVYEDGNEDDQCKEKSVDIELKKATHEISVDSIDINPETVGCGDSFNLNFRVNNMGSADENIKINVKNSELKIDFLKTLTLEAEDSYLASFNFTVPTDATEKTYSLAIDIYYGDNYGSSVKNTANLIVKGKCFIEQKDVAIALQTVGDAFVGKEFSIKTTLTNTGNVPTTYFISVSGYEQWASVVKIEPENITIENGSSGNVYITLLPFENATGENTIKVKIAFGSTTKEETLTVVLRKQTFSAKWFEQLGFELKRNWYWVLIDIILIVAIIVLLILFLKERAHTRNILGKPTEIKVRTISEKEFSKKK